VLGPAGAALVAEALVPAGRSIDIAAGWAHRLHNPGPGDPVFIEVQVGDDFGEDDIVRLEDDVGRADDAG